MLERRNVFEPIPYGERKGWRLKGREEVRERGRDEAGGWGWGAGKSEVRWLLKPSRTVAISIFPKRGIV